ncbi:hypothetical protein M758_UG104700 [Ceratodon purpureus]|nr:hypothetical protein M758_UG104700 [Ceratodon purpureus]
MCATLKSLRSFSSQSAVSPTLVITYTRSRVVELRTLYAPFFPLHFSRYSVESKCRTLGQVPSLRNHHILAPLLFPITATLTSRKPTIFMKHLETLINPCIFYRISSFETPIWQQYHRLTVSPAASKEGLNSILLGL